MFRALAFASILLALQAAAHADVYRWVDAQGGVHYSDRWVPGSTLVKVDKSKSDPESMAARRVTEQNKIATSNVAVSDQQAQANAAKTVQQDIAKTREEQCKQATERYDKAIQARRIFKTGKDGAKEYVSEAEADAYRAQTLVNKQAACGAKAQ
jgi:hypothetical protein